MNTTETKHTRGPWHLSPRGGYVRKSYGATGDGPKDFNIAEMCGNELDAERSANARLIAAAPDLLDACKWALASHAGIRKSMGGDAEPFSCEAALEAAIAKAEGATP